MTSRRALIVGSGFGAAVARAWSATQEISHAEPCMGTLFRVVVHTGNEQQGYEAIRHAFRRAHDLDAKLSDYKADSELMRLQREGYGRPFAASEDLFRVVQKAQQIAGDSEGRFDITVGPLSQLWRQSRKAGRLPERAALREARGRVGYRKVRLDAGMRTITLLHAGMQLDLGGIAKGYAADAMLETLREHGIGAALVVAGGDVAVSGPPGGEAGWKVGVAPEELNSSTTLTLLLARQAVSTSGAHRQHVMIDGVRYSHIVDPRTGLGLTHSATVSVVAPSATESDALATAASVMGPRDGLRFLARRQHVHGRFFLPEGREESTPGFAGLVQGARELKLGRRANPGACGSGSRSR